MKQIIAMGRRAGARSRGRLPCVGDATVQARKRRHLDNR